MLIYSGGIAILQLLVPGPAIPEIGIVGATVLTVVLFLPLRTFLRTIIDQRFSFRKYDAEQVLAPFKERLRAVVDPDQLSENIQMELSYPLISQEELLGLLSVGPRLSGQQYSLDDRTLLSRIAAHAPSALRMATLVQAQQQQVRERERLEQELRTARFIQQSLLPKNVPTLPGWQITPYYQPAREVGGDFYDMLQFDDGRLGLVIGDASGIGVPAALVMATISTMLRTTVREVTSPGEALARVNELLCADIPSKMFVTCFYALLDPSSGRLHYANAGHELRATGMPLGMLPGSSYEEYEVMLGPGESLLFYTDGLVEAHKPQKEMFDYPRLSALIAGYSGGSVLIKFLLSALTCFIALARTSTQDRRQLGPQPW